MHAAVPGTRRLRARVAALALSAIVCGGVGGAAVVGLTVAGALAQPAGAATATTLPSASTASPQPLQVSVSPCGASGTTSPCTQDPTKVAVTWPVSVQGPGSIELSWVPGSGRPQAAPAPADQSVLLQLESASCSLSNSGGIETCGWSWPSSMMFSAGGVSSVLNGTYELTACSLSAGSGCTPDSSFQPVDIGVAAPPGPPATVNASTEASGAVDISWGAPLNAPPDLAGYQVSRDGSAVYSCGLNGSALGSPCPANLEYTDHPGEGHWSYSVQTLRYGVDASPSDAVFSSAATTSLTVSIAPTDTALPPVGSIGGVVLPQMGGNPGAGENVTVPPQAYQEGYGTVGSSGAGSGSAGPTLPGESGGSGSSSATLPYGSSQANAASEAGARETGPGPDLASWKAGALALLFLAFAALAWFLRGELRLFIEGSSAGRPGAFALSRGGRPPRPPGPPRSPGPPRPPRPSGVARRRRTHPLSLSRQVRARGARRRSPGRHRAIT